MKMPNRNRSKENLKPRRLDALAFYLGAHGVNRESALDEIEARLVQETSEEKQEPLRALHALEAKLQQARKEKPEAEALWTRIRKELGDTPPPYFQAIVMACCAFFALTLDTLFLAPTMDILNIADPVFQYLAAAGLAALCTAYFELTGLLYIGAKNSWPQRLTAIAVGGVGVISLMVWGMLRGYQLRFAAALAGNPLGEFLAAHSVLASVFYIFITLATPMIGATALLYGWQEVSKARTWRRVRERFETLRTAEVQLARDVQTEQEHLEEFDKRKQAECLEWRAIFAQFYERGQRNGASRETRWSVLRKSLLGGLCAAPLGFVLPLAWLPALMAIPGLGLFVYFNHRRHHPSHERYLAQENTHFAVIPDAPQPRELRAPQQRLLSKGDDSKGDNQ
ncbi:MAG TPA: hypothetical protein VMV98_01255 [Acidobacteriaceae bacterium]|nr:hypothetical protein [Acidobacteriaceae bacterium]